MRARAREIPTNLHACKRDLHLAHTKKRPSRTLQWDHAYGPMVVLGGGGCFLCARYPCMRERSFSTRGSCTRARDLGREREVEVEVEVARDKEEQREREGAAQR